jgi:pectinesterase
MRVTRRGVVAATAALALAPGAAAKERRFEAWVGPPRGGAASFASVGAALDAAPGDGRGALVRISAGRWREKLVVDKPNITLLGEGQAATLLSFDDASRTTGADGARLGTSGSFSLAVRAPGFSAMRLSIENAFDYDGAARAAVGDQQGAGGLQAVALMLGDGADRARFEDCAVLGRQDTLFANRGRAWFRRCRIAGTVDFVFGAGCALFERCEIVSRLRPDAVGRQGWIAAPSTQRAQEFGLVFTHCRLTKEAGVPAGSVGLGRFWRPTTTFANGRYGDPQAVGAATFLRCWMDDHIAANGWDAMGYNAKDGTRAALAPRDARPAEFASRGPGATPRPYQLSPAEAAHFSPARMMAGWRAF